MRIISGSFRGTKLDGIDIEGTRPTMDRVKESVFSIIQDYLVDSVCLDLFAGSGSLGLETLSRGSSFCYFVDHNSKAVKVIENNISKLRIASKTRILEDDSFKSLDLLMKLGVKFDIVFLDPPYQSKLLENILIYLSVNNLLNNKAIVVCEFENDILMDKYNQLELKTKKKYGKKKIYIYQKSDNI